MTKDPTPAGILQQLVALFDQTGIALLFVADASLFLENGNGPAFEKWSTFFNRLYRYHDFCALELSELIAQGGKGADHLPVEMKKHEALSGAYRLADMAMVAADPGKDKSLPNPAVLEDEMAAIQGAMLILFWAFATRTERQLFSDTFKTLPEADDLALLIDASPNDSLTPMGDVGSLLEDLAEDLPIEKNMFGRMIYPPQHPAVEMDRAYTDEEMDFLKDFKQT